MAAYLKLDVTRSSSLRPILATSDGRFDCVDLKKWTLGGEEKVIGWARAVRVRGAPSSAPLPGRPGSPRDPHDVVGAAASGEPAVSARTTRATFCATWVQRDERLS
jgi:hypothetical protein